MDAQLLPPPPSTSQTPKSQASSSFLRKSASFSGSESDKGKSNTPTERNNQGRRFSVQTGGIPSTPLSRLAIDATNKPPPSPPKKHPTPTSPITSPLLKRVQSSDTAGIERVDGVVFHETEAAPASPIKSGKVPEKV